MPYLFTTPETHGHGSLRAAVGALVAEIHTGIHYFYDGRDMLSPELAGELWKLVAHHELSGEVPRAIAFSRSHGAPSVVEFTIVKRDDAKVYIVTDADVTEAGTAETAIEWPGSSAREKSDA